jgi:hypothetical protein
MKQNETATGYPSLDNLEGMTVEQLLQLRQEIRKIRDARRVASNEEQTRISRKYTARVSASAACSTSA